ncbi:hypothetical protein NDU88_011206 [Pleurodeles waltl]|uniref:Uncharacterized protein n=1 Tax=Pleurodeles waltl TaxID=8319 RepID=A0AAV7S5G6_PLEWA|nr:hypothetical protein NDU88_011206 [Pleurodeles waltl]
MRMCVIFNKIQSAHALQKCPLRGAVPDGEIDKIAGAHAHSCAHAHITEPTRFGRGAAKDRTPAMLVRGTATAESEKLKKDKQPDVFAVKVL